MKSKICNMLNSEQNPERSVATEVDSSTKAGYHVIFKSIHLQIIKSLTFAA
jgi:hypothetical protein